MSRTRSHVSHVARSTRSRFGAIPRGHQRATDEAINVPQTQSRSLDLSGRRGVVHRAGRTDGGAVSPRHVRAGLDLQRLLADGDRSDRPGEVAGGERRDHRHTDQRRRRLATHQPGLPGRTGRRLVPVRRGVYRGRHAPRREERVGDQRHLHDAGRWAGGASRCNGRRAGPDRQSRAADTLRRRDAANPAASSTAEPRRCRRSPWRRPRGSSGPGLRVDVSAARLDGIQAK